MSILGSLEAARTRNGVTGKPPNNDCCSFIELIMKIFKYYILPILIAITLAACADDVTETGHDLQFCVRAAWQNGFAEGDATRALPMTDLLAPGTGDIPISTDDYPPVINMVAKSGDDVIQKFNLTKGNDLCGTHSDATHRYWDYTPSFLFRDALIKREDYHFYASAVIDGDEPTSDVLVGEADQSSIEGTHMKITLHHTKALIRFAFKVDDNYDKIRYIQVTKIKLNGKYAVLVDKVLSTSSQYIAYAYIDPTEVTVSTVNTIECTYDIYDKDASWDVDGTPASDNADHITRHNVTATNRFKLGNLRKDDVPVSTISPGYYYDLIVTINPDYLYVLSEHDNQHLTIN